MHSLPGEAHFVSESFASFKAFCERLSSLTQEWGERDAVSLERGACKGLVGSFLQHGAMPHHLRHSYMAYAIYMAMAA